LTPPSPTTPRINSAKVFGATPGNPFLYTIASTDAKPLHFFADHLPAGRLKNQKTVRLNYQNLD
jgi:alpha-galactosidase